MTLISTVNLDVEYCHYSMWTEMWSLWGSLISCCWHGRHIVCLSTCSPFSYLWVGHEQLLHGCVRALCCGGLLQTMLFNWAEKLLHWLLSRFRKLSMWCHYSLSSLYQLEQQDPRTENQTRGLILGDKWHCFWTFESDYNVRRYFFEHGLICIYWFWKFTRLQLLNPTNGDARQSFW